MSEPSATVFDIQRFSLHDGPGIRTTVFLKGCNLRCAWCHNPEGVSAATQLQYTATLCIACGSCVAACPNGAHLLRDGLHGFDRSRCTVCGACAQACPAQALVTIGRRLTVSETLAEVVKDRPFYEHSAGGVTVSGGEPLLQRRFIRALFSQCAAQGVHTAIETAGDCPWSHLEDVLEVTDLVMMDLKHLDPEKHRAGTGADNRRILENAARLAATGKPVIFRTPVIPGFNDAPEEIEAIRDFVLGLSRVRPDGSPRLEYELLPYHPLAGGKYAGLGMPEQAAGLATIPADRMKELTALARLW